MRPTLVIVLLLSLFVATNAVAPFAVYSLTLDSPNAINVFAGSATGALTFSTSVLTGGNGATGIFQSQHSIIAYGGYVFAVNPLSDTVSMLAISPSDPTVLTLVGTPMATNYNYPVSVTAKVGVVCVACSGILNGVHCYTYDSAGLHALSTDQSFGLSLTTPPLNHVGPGQISFTPDGTGLLLANKTPPPPAPYSLFLISSTNVISATPAQSMNMGVVNFAFAWDSNGDAIAVDAAPYAPASNIGGVAVLTVSTTGAGSITSQLPGNYWNTTGLIAPCWIERAAVAGRFYAGMAGSQIVLEFSRAGTGASTTFTALNQYSFGTSVTDITVVNLNGQEYVYALLPGAKTIAGLKLTEGATTPAALSGNVTFTGIKPTGLASSVYVAVPSSTGGSNGATAITASVVTVIAAIACAIKLADV